MAAAAPVDLVIDCPFKSEFLNSPYPILIFPQLPKPPCRARHPHPQTAAGNHATRVNATVPAPTAISTTGTATTIEETVSVMSTVRRRCLWHEVRRIVGGGTTHRLRLQGVEIVHGNGNGIIGIASVITSGTGTETVIFRGNERGALHHAVLDGSLLRQSAMCQG